MTATRNAAQQLADAIEQIEEGRWDEGQVTTGLAIATALIEMLPLVREIGDQLDTLHLRLARCDEVDKLGQRCVLRPDHDGPHRAGRPLDTPMDIPS